MEYERRAWSMPDVHVRIYDWLERTDGARRRVLRVFRGCGKSTILGVRNAHKYLKDPKHQILAQGADDDLTDDLSRDTLAILRAHPLTQGLLVEPAGVRHWFTVDGEKANARTPQFRGRGILSRVTGNRANEIQNDDVEVEKNVTDEAARKKLRKKLAEQTHILTPGGSRLFVGTPHAHNSLYDQIIAEGAEELTIPLFESLDRYAPGKEPRSVFPFKGRPRADGVWVFVGIGKNAQLLMHGADYRIVGNEVRLHAAISAVIDICTGNAWPERFHRQEMLERRRECLTLGEFDSQYQLEAKPIGEVRLDPERIIPYDLKPVLKTANREPMLMLGNVRLVSAACRWDCALGKIKTDASAISLVFTDARGHLYWQFAVGLTGDIDEQCAAVRKLVIEYHIPSVTVETNGPGGFVPPILRKHLKGLGEPGKVLPALNCGVVEDHASTNKNKDILDAFEAPMSIGALWAHIDVLDGPTWDQMKDWNPAVAEQPDDYLDSGARAIRANPVRIGRGHAAVNAAPLQREIWRPVSGVHEITLEA